MALEVDGGIHEQTAGPVVQAGANLLVTGSAVFGSDDPAAAYERIRSPRARCSCLSCGRGATQRCVYYGWEERAGLPR